MGTALTQTYQGLAVVTGASSGIGRELAKIFASKGYDLLVTAEDEGIFEVADELKEFGVTVEVCRADLRCFDAVHSLYGKIKQIGRPVECIALNAGVGVGGAFQDTELHAELDMIQLNIASTVHLTKHILRDMLAIGRGKILMTSSIAALMPGPYYAVYAATKSFIQSFAEAVRFEVKDTGISVTALQPGATDTNFFARADMLDTKAGAGKKDDSADVARVAFDAMMAAKDHVVGGSFMNVVQAKLSNIVSDPIGAALQGRSTKPLHSKS